MESVRIDLLPPEFKTWVVVLMAVFAAGIYLAVRLLLKRFAAGAPRIAVLPRMLLAFITAWCFLQALGRFAAYGCTWPLWLAALIMGGGVEAALISFEYERRALSRRMGHVIMLLRGAAIAIAALILMQPVLIRYIDKKITRRVAVLVDESTSMRFVDQQWQPEECLGFATRQGLITPEKLASVRSNQLDAATLWKDFDQTQRDAVLASCSTTRLALACEILATPDSQGNILLDKLGARYDLNLFSFGRALRDVTREDLAEGRTSPGSAGFNAAYFQSATDYTRALESVLADIPSEQLAGVLFLSDGIYNADASIQPVTRRLAAQGVIVSSVLVGGSRLPFDIALADVLAPESIFLGDKVKFQATLKATGAIGKRVKLTLSSGDAMLDEVEVDISSDDWQRELRLTHEPLTNGVMRYEVKVDTLPGELFADNNLWYADVAVSDDRINVLLVDSAPRWEFRYLRNLFFGRDKSVHLQSWLVHPDTLGNVAGAPLPDASAARKFGDAESGGWPKDEEAWRAFDVIVLGDIEPSVLTPEIQERIRVCVADRGALLVLIGGPNSMPHAFPADSIIAKLAPFTVRAAPDYWVPPEQGFKLELTAVGQSHPVMVQSGSMLENEELWKSQEEFHWRLPVTAKPGAEVLAIAVSEGDQQDKVLTDARDAVAHLEERMQYRNRRALIATQRFGRGKVLGLAFDRTWRLRYRIGDTRHHRFWGQVMRWGLGERLRAGTEKFRAGTDRLVYSPEDPVTVMARLLDESYVGIEDAELRALISCKDQGVESEITLQPREGANGFYEAMLPPFPRGGAYTLQVIRKDIVAQPSVETAFLVTESRRPVEMGVVQVQSETLQALAKGTGGMLTRPGNEMDLIASFGEGKGVVQERLEYALWNNPWVLLLLALLLTTEWILRKRGGLA